jgi:hypothetical protein
MLWHAAQGAGGLVGGGGASGIQYVGGTTDGWSGALSNTTSLTSLSGGLASSPAQDDLVLLWWGIADNSKGNVTIQINTAGYTTLYSIKANDSVDTDFVVAYKFMGASPDTSVQFAATGSGTSNGLCVQVWRGVDTTSPIVTSNSTTSINGTLPNPPSVTVSVSGAMGAAGGAYGHEQGTQTLSSSDLDGFQTVGSVSVDDVSTGAGYNANVSGTYNPAQFTFSGSTSARYSMCAATLALRPA